MNSRECVRRALRFDPGLRVPRHLWRLPWADVHYPGMADKLSRQYPDDLAWAPGFPRVSLRTTGDAHRKGIYVDPWGCIFENIQDGIMGEVKEPIVRDWTDTSRMRFPEEMHAFYFRQFEVWAATAVDAFFLIDDWGSQNGLLIHPDLWRKHFKPLYAEYAALARAAGTRVFMHSDGTILAILPDLIEIGVDAINSQIFAWARSASRPSPAASRSGEKLTASICWSAVRPSKSGRQFVT